MDKNGVEEIFMTRVTELYAVEQLLFSIVPSILTFDFYLILGSSLTFWGPNGLFLGSE